MTYPADPNQPYQYQPEQSAWEQSRPPNTGGFPPTQQQPGYGAPFAPTGQFPAVPPTGGGRSKGLLAVVAALSVAVVGLGVGLVISLNRSGSAGGSPSTVTVTSTAGGDGATVTVTEPGTGDGATVTVTETANGFGDGAQFSSGRIEGVIGEPADVVTTDYNDETSKYTVTLHSAEWKDALEGQYVEPPTDTYLVLDVTIEVFEGRVDYDPDDWTAKDAESREYQDEFAFSSDLQLLGNGTAAPGEKVRGYVVFDLPRGESTLLYTQLFGDDDGVTYKVPA